jgi:hypothetical protein
VDVIVDESGQQEVVTMIRKHGPRRQLLKHRVGWPERRNTPILDDEGAIGEIPVARGIGPIARV